MATHSSTYATRQTNDVTTAILHCTNAMQSSFYPCSVIQAKGAELLRRALQVFPCHQSIAQFLHTILKASIRLSAKVNNNFKKLVTLLMAPQRSRHVCG